MKKWILIISIAFNLIFVLGYGLNYLCTPTYKLGKLNRDVKIGMFNIDKKNYFTLPKGLTVRDVSEQGLNAIDRIENNRFELIMTSDDETLVNYNVQSKDLSVNDNLYSILSK